MYYGATGALVRNGTTLHAAPFLIRKKTRSTVEVQVKATVLWYYTTFCNTDSEPLARVALFPTDETL